MGSIKKIEYDCDCECWLAGYREYIKSISKNKIIIFCVQFGILSLLLIYQIVIEPDCGICWAFLAICIFTIVITLIEPIWKIKRAEANLDDINSRRYILKIYSDKLIITEIHGYDERSFAYFDDKRLKGFDRGNYFLLFTKRFSTNIFFCVIPKKSLSEADNRSVSELIEKISKKINERV